jgi:endonuclease-3
LKDIEKIINILQKRYKVKIEKEDPFEVLIHGILSARTKDETTFPAQERLLKVANTPEKILKLPTKEIEKLIYPVGFYRVKAKRLKEACKFIIDNFDGKVPNTKEELMKIPGVGPKIASLVLVWGYNIPSIPVDTHVNRISKRLGIVPKDSKPEDTQNIIEKIIPDNMKIIANRLFVEFGKDICKPIRPECFRCDIYDYCKFEKKTYYRLKNKKSK